MGPIGTRVLAFAVGVGWGAIVLTAKHFAVKAYQNRKAAE